MDTMFNEKSYGSAELRRVEILLEGIVTDEVGLDRIDELFQHLETNPPSDRLKKACAENMTRSGGKLLDRSKYTPNK